MTVLVRAELTLVDDSRNEFTETAKALVAAAADEPGTLRYAWYRTADPNRFVVIEEYTDAAAAFAHNANVAELLHRMSTVAEISLLQLHGDLTPDLLAFAEQIPAATTHLPLM